MRLANVTSLHHARSGIRGLDDILRGGFRRRRLYVIEGDSGTGKTTLGLQFLLAGVEAGERGLYISLSDTKEELEHAARGHGWSGVDRLDVCEIGPRDVEVEVDSLARTAFEDPLLTDLEDAMNAVLGVVEEMGPHRVVIDSLAELRVLAVDTAQYRRQLQNLKQSLSARACTTLLLDDPAAANDQGVQRMAHGVLTLEQLASGYGHDRRQLRLRKLREPDFFAGYHDYAIRVGGIDVYPRLQSIEEEDSATDAPLSSGIAQLDALVGGHIERGTSTLILGAAGVGKSTVTSQYVRAAAQRGESSAVFLFQESRASWLSRAESLGMKLDSHVEKGTVHVEHLSATTLSPGELVCRISDVAREGRSLIVLDGLNGLEMGMVHERYLALHLSDLLDHLGQRGVNTFLTLEQHGLVDGGASAAVWFIADNVLVLRYLDAFGDVRRAISMMKKRVGDHERTIRELSITSGNGLFVGEPVADFSGVLSGIPTYVGDGKARP